MLLMYSLYLSVDISVVNHDGNCCLDYLSLYFLYIERERERERLINDEDDGV